MSWRERLRAAIQSSGRRHAAIAADAGVAPETLSRILNAVGARPELDTVTRIAHAVRENVGWLLDEKGFTLSAADLEKVGQAVDILQRTLFAAPPPKREAAGAPNAAALPRRSRAGIPLQWSGARVLYRAVGETMIEAGIADGDFLFVRPMSDVRAAAGRIVVCRVGGATYVKQLELYSGRIRLLSRNERFAPIEVDEEADHFELVGIVVGRAGPPALM